ncbi:sulfurtransferase complex subunit TusD [Buchnera aphidicola (Formosaphis micheliae)]|uniref:sulfurtransferase complex subunit TusD n=1 Tax=Buchnera aphidicola TaxID=9 RepID=UPI0031B8459B
MHYLVIVTGSVYGTENSSTAFLFCKEVVHSGHKLHSVFFYFSGVLNANRMVFPAIDECNLVKSWSNFSIKFKIKLNVCISAASRRGVISDENALRLGMPVGNLNNSFKLIGLSGLSEAIYMCDRIIQF